jgi:hypothetical protein
MQVVLKRCGKLFDRFEAPLYALWAGLCVIVCARSFYGYMLRQTGGEWSAPLDDVFIHFDYARATARGHPFEWVAGNGYSSGDTSLSYPFVLAIGWAAGFRGERLVVWSAIVAMVSVFGTLLATRSLFFEAAKNPRDVWARLSSFVLPPVLLGVGALDWTLWSGMEVAFFLAVWALALCAFLALDRARGTRAKKLAWLLGLAGAMLVVTRPEGATTIAVFGAAAAFARGRADRLGVLVRSGVPSAVVLVLQSLANRAFTGEWSPNGAIAKLAVNHPYMSAAEKWEDYLFNLKYAVLRNVEYHFADKAELGVLIPALAFAAIAAPRTRRVALLLAAQAAGWMVLVAMNGQVRWQNERYTMPAVAWVLMMAALGISALLRREQRPNVVLATLAGALLAQLYGICTRPPNTLPWFRLAWTPVIGGAFLAALMLRFWPLRAACALAAVYFAYQHQAPKMRDQRWFFGRASRNIRDQHITLGRWLAEKKPKRVLVGDAGAILYTSDQPGLDIIGLGGYGDLPFARAGLHGLPATIELMEHVPPNDRPDMLAIFPTWWGILPTWFSTEVLERFPVEGNVICGGYEHVVYRADWHLLGSGTKLRGMPPGDTRVVDALDVGDLVSEDAHRYVFPKPHMGWADMKILPDPASPAGDMLDGGRFIEKGQKESFRLRGLTKGARAHLVFRTAPHGKTRIIVRVNGTPAAALPIERYEGWLEPAVEIPADLVTTDLDVEVFNEGPEDFNDYHVWATQ